ncbi:OB-fold domain-containing protein [Acrocarpospora macrocephala]|uniref:DNA-binding protein n=1 Tax=Acrocarpospora macrocephala TaxID=150177 RepID=A0A5M3WPM8_9ACTN|nr:OB-fold domain-containing protein [Acrocarpospora macrocephala]GES11287.1 DNA-binding protein [Acrocarpospora macrocephala]
MNTPLTPKASQVTTPFWEGTKQGELRIQRCNACARFYFQPRTSCRHCQSLDVEWRPVSGRATLASYVINRRPMWGTEPQVIALVELDEGPRLMTNIVEVAADPEALPLGMRLEVRFSERGDMSLPMFAPARGEA